MMRWILAFRCTKAALCALILTRRGALWTCRPAESDTSDLPRLCTPWQNTNGPAERERETWSEVIKSACPQRRWRGYRQTGWWWSKSTEQSERLFMGREVISEKMGGHMEEIQQKWTEKAARETWLVCHTPVQPSAGGRQQVQFKP